MHSQSSGLDACGYLFEQNDKISRDKNYLLLISTALVCISALTCNCLSPEQVGAPTHTLSVNLTLLVLSPADCFPLVTDCVLGAGKDNGVKNSE